MRSRTLPAVAISVAALGLAAAVAPVAGAHNPPLSPRHHGLASAHIVPMKKGNCYSSLHNDTGDAINSQDYEAAYDAYDSAGADNFSVKKTCKVTGIYVVGQYFNGSGPAVSETVNFYANGADGKPGQLESSQTVTGTDNAGTFTIPLKVLPISPGQHWVSVVVNMDFDSGGQWGWEVTGNTKQGSGAMWRNPQDGFGTGCQKWDKMEACTGAMGADFMFTLTK